MSVLPVADSTSGKGKLAGIRCALNPACRNINRKDIMDKKTLWGIVIIGYSILIGILILTRVIEGGIGGGLFMGGFIILLGLRKKWVGKEE